MFTTLYSTALNRMNYSHRKIITITRDYLVQDIQAKQTTNDRRSNVKTSLEIFTVYSNWLNSSFLCRCVVLLVL